MEITRSNFNEEFNNIAYNLQKSCFIGFDAEFTAILSGDSFKYRLFDSCEERYDRIKNEVSKMIMTQVGLTMFHYDRERDSYNALGYTFHLCPQVFGDVDQSFIFQASTLNFLCRHKFDFNKFTYHGLPYLSKSEAERVKQQLRDNILFNNLTRTFDMDDEHLLQKYGSEVSKWLSLNEEETMYIDVENPILRYVMHNEIRMRFPDVLTTDSLGDSKRILIYRDKYVEGATSAPKAILDENLFDHLLGFSRIISLLEMYKKPIVGHNVFLDLVLLHNQFIGPLPNSYATFKRNVNAVLPEVYDTKYISHNMSKKLTHEEVWKSNTLQDLYEFFSQRKCKKLEIGANIVNISTPFNNNQSYHEAGWDSYCSGFCFVRLGHWSACEISGTYRPVGPTQKLSALSKYCNKINVIRGAVPYMNLVAEDPPKHRPEWLHVRALDQRINVANVASLLSSFGSVDVRPCGHRSAIVATSTQHIADKILKQMRGNDKYRVSRYSVYRHSPLGRFTMWSGAFLTGGVMIYFIHKNLNR